MARLKSVSAYADGLRKAVEERKGKYDMFLEPLISVTATNWRTLDIVTRKLWKEGLTIIEQGSRGQEKTTAHPLNVAQEKLFRALRSNLQGLGLTYDIIPEKINKAKKEDVSEDIDPLCKILAEDY